MSLVATVAVILLAYPMAYFLPSRSFVTGPMDPLLTVPSDELPAAVFAWKIVSASTGAINTG